ARRDDRRRRHRRRLVDPGAALGRGLGAQSGGAAVTVGTFDPLIHAPNRLQICATLDTVDRVEFALLREQLGGSGPVLSKQVKALEDAGSVTVTKATREGRVRSWASITRQGKVAYRAHVAALRVIVG